jgi:hypothetical protein
MEAAFQGRSDILKDAFLGLRMHVSFDIKTKASHLYLDWFFVCVWYRGA